MVRALLLLFVGATAFGGAAAASWWFQNHQNPTALTAAHSSPGHPAPQGSPASSAETAPTAEPSAADEHLPPPAASGLPIAVRPQPMNVEELLRYGLALNARDAALEVREREATERETQMQLALADIRSEQQTIDALRAQIQQQLEAADALLARIDEARRKFAEERTRQADELQKFQSERIEMSDQERENIKRLATWVSAMEPAKAGGILKEMANDGRLATAVKILSHLEERAAAQILDALDDTALIDLLLQEYQKLKTPPKSANRR